ncbi:MAG: BrnT family toxin [Methylobacter sp.]|nr:BrnT family toxin [Methylobacter sp.]
MHFEWDPKKARANRRKHGVTFQEATSALRDVFSATAHDPDHSDDVERFVTFGVSSQGRLLTVSHTDRGNAIRIISARLATNAERQIYEEG